MLSNAAPAGGALTAIFLARRQHIPHLRGGPAGAIRGSRRVGALWQWDIGGRDWLEWIWGGAASVGWGGSQWKYWCSARAPIDEFEELPRAAAEEWRVLLRQHLQRQILLPCCVGSLGLALLAGHTHHTLQPLPDIQR
jgi:hypothetical protein